LKGKTHHICLWEFQDNIEQAWPSCLDYRRQMNLLAWMMPCKEVNMCLPHQTCH
jgi:hypothetical protein